ncbi:MAG: WG repeat-containing protein [Acidobacteriota bacterium]|nr:WG repeat-containing protein [Acidobacteriota bacterium]
MMRSTLFPTGRLFPKTGGLAPTLTRALHLFVGVLLSSLLLASAEEPRAAEEPAEAAAHQVIDCQPVDCVYASVGEVEELSSRGECGCIEESGEGALRLYPEHLEQLAFDDQGLATVYAGNRVAYVTRGGQSTRESRTAWMLKVDNGPDYFVEGLARTAEGGKVGFVNRRLEPVIAPRWDFAFPFDDGLAVVCDGCRAQPSCPTCEHSEIIGGDWGYIDRQGEEIVVPMFSREELPERGMIAIGE